MLTPRVIVRVHCSGVGDGVVDLFFRLLSTFVLGDVCKTRNQLVKQCESTRPEVAEWVQNKYNTVPGRLLRQGWGGESVHAYRFD